MQNLDYTIISGARRQENRWDPTQNQQIVPETNETQKRLFDDSMFKLEHGAEDINTAETEKPRLVKLFARNESTWGDDYTANSKLRQEFRVWYQSNTYITTTFLALVKIYHLLKICFIYPQSKSKQLKESAAHDKALLAKSSLSIKLVPELEEDKKTARLLSMKLKPSADVVKNTDLLRKQILSQSSLPTSSFSLKKEKKAVKLLNSKNSSIGIVMKRTATTSSDTSDCSDSKKVKSVGLVDYGSSTDSE